MTNSEARAFTFSPQASLHLTVTSCALLRPPLDLDQIERKQLKMLQYYSGCVVDKAACLSSVNVHMNYRSKKKGRKMLSKFTFLRPLV